MRNYVKPVPLEVNTETHPPPELQEFKVILALFRIQKQLLPLLVTILGQERQLPKPSFSGDALWNKSLSSQTCSTGWKEANINSLPKVDIPLQHPNFRGINVTPVIACCFERTVHHHYSKKVFEENLMETQYAYRDGCSCIYAFIQIQHNHLKAFDGKH